MRFEMTRSYCARLLARKGLLILLTLASGAVEPAETTDSVIVPFSSGLPGTALPPPWRIVTLPKPKHPTQYTLVADAGTVALRAESKASMASVVHPLSLDPANFAFISWRWKISNVLRKSDIHTKAGDDFPARVYVLFDYDVAKLSVLQRIRLFVARKFYGGEVPTAALCYVWDGKAPIGTTVWSPYTDRVRIIVVESGSPHRNRWRKIERNLVTDFRAAFGENPPAIGNLRRGCRKRHR